MSAKRYPAELRERAVRMVFELREQEPADRGVIGWVAKKLGIGDQSLRSWVSRAEIDIGKKPGVTTAEAQRIKELEKEVRELRRTNEILKAASAVSHRRPTRTGASERVHRRTSSLRGSSRSAGHSVPGPEPTTSARIDSRRSDRFATRS